MRFSNGSTYFGADVHLFMWNSFCLYSHRFLEDESLKSGDVMTIWRSPIDPVLVVKDPSAVLQICEADSGFSKQPGAWSRSAASLWDELVVMPLRRVLFDMDSVTDVQNLLQPTIGKSFNILDLHSWRTMRRRTAPVYKASHIDQLAKYMKSRIDLQLSCNWVGKVSNLFKHFASLVF